MIWTFIHFCFSLSQWNCCIHNLLCSCKHTFTNTYSGTCNGLPVKPSDVWSCFAWFRRRARGDKPLHLNSHISCGQSKKKVAREIKVEHRERESCGHSDLYILQSFFQCKMQYHIVLCASTALFAFDQNWQTCMGQIRIGAHWGGILYAITLQIRGERNQQYWESPVI